MKRVHWKINQWMRKDTHRSNFLGSLRTERIAIIPERSRKQCGVSVRRSGIKMVAEFSVAVSYATTMSPAPGPALAVVCDQSGARRHSQWQQRSQLQLPELHLLSDLPGIGLSQELEPCCEWHQVKDSFEPPLNHSPPICRKIVFHEIIPGATVQVCGADVRTVMFSPR